ncbi:band 7 protein [Thiorhodococcus drewsii AZ1]|uniref:Band 7 protein n=1 Tax=Thiorhodococcus drewsii AZ1 TaxID=765913 RepID=G2E6D2_9GAMM|nr:prohibitin family protein [Thiorhodococcus drewsii]EGV28390.1 band 7 protein [Thiorhodococcus drewsii AZ1]
MATVKKRMRRLTNGMAFTILIIFFAVIILWNRMIFTTPVGHASIVWHRLWAGERRSLGPMAEGLHIILPWDKFYTYDVRLQSSDQRYEVVSHDGLHLEITLSFRWRAEKDGIVDLNQSVGPNYLNTLLVPVVGSVAREVIAEHDAEKLFSVERGLVQNQIFQGVVSPNYPNGIGSHRAEDLTDSDHLINLEDVLIKRVTLPPQLRDAIEKKLEQAQKVKEYAYRAERERFESERKAIEAQGIRRFQEIVTPAISESYLRWRGIEATLKLAESNNSKVVVIGNAASGLPLILDTRTESAPAMAPRLSPDIDPGPLDPPDQSLLETGEGAVTLSKPALKRDGGDLDTGDLQTLPLVTAGQNAEGRSIGSPPLQSQGTAIDRP